jgi:hypothetical protein
VPAVSEPSIASAPKTGSRNCASSVSGVAGEDKTLRESSQVPILQALATVFLGGKESRDAKANKTNSVF